MFGLFRNKETTMDNSNKLKEGMFKKESRHRKVWRDRWVVLKETKLYTFENQDSYRNPTEAIDANTIKIVKIDKS